MLHKARIVRDGTAVRPLPQPTPRVIPREVGDAQARAEQLITSAQARAESLLVAAQQDADELRTEAYREGLAAGQAAALVQALRFQEAEHAADKRHLDRTCALARVMAERLLGDALHLDPSVLARLARQVLSETRGAARATLECHPTRVDELRQTLAASGIDLELTVAANPALDVLDLRLDTDVGVLEAPLAERLDLLAHALRAHLADEAE